MPRNQGLICVRQECVRWIRLSRITGDSGNASTKTAKRWARDNIFWDAAMLIVPALALYWRNRTAHIDWPIIETTLLLYGIVFVVYALVHVCLVPRKLDRERDEREHELNNIIVASLTTIANQQDQISASSQRPKRSPAEQHDYDTVKRALDVVKDRGKIALRFLRNKGSITLGMSFGNPASGPAPPPPMTWNDLAWVYHHCESEGIVTMKSDLGRTSETFTISPHMSNALDGVLFEE